MSTIVGIDPGLHSLGLAVLEDGRITQCVQFETPKRERHGDEGHRWIHIVSGIIADVKPQVVAIEDFEPQAWKLRGRQPKGGSRMQQLISQMRHVALLANCIVYTQSPSLTRLPAAVVDAAIRKDMGAGVVVTAHLRDAVAHAWAAEATYNVSRRAK